MMLGAMIKTYLAEQRGIAPSDISMVSIMPCVRKQGGGKELDLARFAVTFT